MSDPQGTWVEQEFGGSQLKDARLQRRLHGTVQRMWQRLGARLPTACQSRAEAVGAYRLFDHARVTTDAVLASHQAATTARTAGEPVVLVPLDRTELWFSQEHLVGAGPLTSEHRRGVYVQVALAVTPAGVPLGVLGLDWWAREGLGQRRDRTRQSLPPTDKESAHWLTGYETATKLAQARPDAQIIAIADREADWYALFTRAHAAQQTGRAAGWLVRAQHDRRLAPADSPYQRLRLQVALAPVRTRFTLRLPATPRRPARQAACTVRVAQVTLQPPRTPQGRDAEPLTVTALLVTEQAPPPGRTPVHWLLLTDQPADTPRAARQVVDWYAARWGIEVFFRTLKSGCKVETWLLRDMKRLAPGLAVCAVLAWRVLFLLLCARATPNLPASRLLDPAEWHMAWVWCHHRPPPVALSLRIAIRLIAQVGGFQARTGDGEPGAQNLWRGSRAIWDAIAGVEAERAAGRRCV